MNIVELNQKEILTVSGGMFYTLLFSNLCGYVGLNVGLLLLYTVDPYFKGEKPNLALAFSTAVHTIFLNRRGIKGTILTAALIAGGCALGTFVGWCIAKPLSLIGIVNID